MSSEEPFSTWKQLCGSSSVVSLWPQLHQLFFYYPHLFFLVLHQPAHFHGGGTALDFHWKRRHIKEDSNRSSVAMAQQNKLMTGKYTNLVSQRGLPCDKHTKRKRPLSRRIYPAQQRGSAGTGNRWKVSSFHQHIVLPPPVSFWSFHYKSDSFFFSSLFQESLVIIIKKKQIPTLCILPSRPFPEYSIFKVLWLCPHLTLFDEAPTEKTTLETSPPPVLGSALLSSAAKHPEYPPAYKGATS